MKQGDQMDESMKMDHSKHDHHDGSFDAYGKFQTKILALTCFIDSDHRSFADDGNAVALPIHFSGF